MVRFVHSEVNQNYHCCIIHFHWPYTFCLRFSESLTQNINMMKSYFSSCYHCHYYYCCRWLSSFDFPLSTALATFIVNGSNCNIVLATHIPRHTNLKSGSVLIYRYLGMKCLSAKIDVTSKRLSYTIMHYKARIKSL